MSIGSPQQQRLQVGPDTRPGKLRVTIARQGGRQSPEVALMLKQESTAPDQR